MGFGRGMTGGKRRERGYETEERDEAIERTGLRTVGGGGRESETRRTEAAVEESDFE